MDLIDLSKDNPLLSVNLSELEFSIRIEAAKRFASKKDILNWGKVVFSDKFRLPFCSELHNFLIESRNSEFLCLEAPRSHSKTTIKCFLIPIFMALNEYTNPYEDHDYFLNVQATEQKALAINTAIRHEFETNQILHTLYGDMMGREKWTDSIFVLKNGIVFSAISAGQSMRGIQFHNRRPDYINIDDLYDESDIRNPDSTENKNAWFFGSLFPARTHSKKSCVHIQGTAINQDDLLFKLKSDKRFTYRSFKAVLDWDSKKMLWPEAYSFKDAENDLKSMGPTIFAREMQNERQDSSAAIIKSDWLINPSWEYDPNSVRWDNTNPILRVMITCDPSIGKKEDNDPSAFAVVIKSQNMNGGLPVFYIDSLHNELLSLQARVDRIKSYVNEYARFANQTEMVAIIETIAGFKDFGDLVTSQIPVMCDLIDRVPDKITNLEKKSYLFQNRRIFLNKNIAPELKQELTNQLLNNYPRHDDLRDAVLLALNDADTGIWRY